MGGSTLATPTGPLHPSIVEALLEPNVIKGLNILIGIAKSLGTIATQGGSLAAVHASLVTPTLQPVLPVPVSAKDVVLAAIAAQEFASATPDTARLPLTVAAGATSVFPNSPPSGYVWVLAAPLFAVTNVHTEKILVTASVDGRNVVANYVMIRDDVLPIAQYSVITSSLELEVTNDTFRSIQFATEVQYGVMASKVYDDRVKIAVQDGNALLDVYTQAAKLRLQTGGA